MPRGKSKTARVDDDFDYEQAGEPDRGEDREDEREMFTDAVESPLYIPREDWPKDMAVRWVSIEAGGAPDSRNWSVKTSAGWTPVLREHNPKIDARFPVIPMPGREESCGGTIVYGGLCLCQRPMRDVLRDKKRQERATQDAGRTVETYVEGGNSNIPRFNQSSPVQYERGVRPAQFKE